MNLVSDPELLARYGCGPIRFSGDPNALYERHLLFDDIVAPRDQFCENLRIKLTSVDGNMASLKAKIDGPGFLNGERPP
jgi:hypothetical protein